MATTTPSISQHKIRSRPSAGVLHDSPRTPLSRSVSGLYGSPGSSFRIDDENLLIFEFGSRCLRAGFAGESAPRCKLTYSPEMWRRVGDYRQWAPDYPGRTPKGKKWAQGYELWDLDVRNMDLGLVEDRVEKLVREAESKYLLLDNRAKRVALAAPSNLPRPLLSIVLRKLFDGLQAASISVLPSSIMACVGAGVRSALVVDLGWFETTVCAVYEYREMRQFKSIRAGKMLSRSFKKMLERELKEQGTSQDAVIGFDEVQEIVDRMAWCLPHSSVSDNSSTASSEQITLPVRNSHGKGTEGLRVPMRALSNPVEVVLFASDTQPRELDDHDIPIPQLLFKALLQLPSDVRNLCISTIIFTGGVSNIPGLKARVLRELGLLIDSKGWDPVREYSPRLGLSRLETKGTSVGEENANARQSTSSPPAIKVTESTTDPPPEEPTPTAIPAHARPHDTNPIDAKLASLALRDVVPTPPKGEVRAVNTLGAWAGASLVTNLRIKGVVEIERDRFMSHGLVGGAVPGSVKPGASVVDAGYGRSRQSLGANAKLGEKSSTGWSLGVWA